VRGSVVVGSFEAALFRLKRWQGGWWQGARARRPLQRRRRRAQRLRNWLRWDSCECESEEGISGAGVQSNVCGQRTMAGGDGLALHGRFWPSLPARVRSAHHHCSEEKGRLGGSRTHDGQLVA
jgi:hypothetical protein